MKIITWNVNGIRACIKNGFFDVIHSMEADIICVQEIKANEKQVALKGKGYLQYWNSARREGYSGILTLLKYQPMSVRHGFGIEKFDIEGRITTIEYKDVYVLNVYFPMSQSGLNRKNYRNEWDSCLLEYVKTLNKPIIMCGDFNVAHKYIDIYEENLLNIENSTGFEPIERANFDNLLHENLIDVFRFKNPFKKQYTWWSYRLNKRDENRGWRLDYVLVSKKLLYLVNDIQILSDIKGSDHCPVMLDIKIKLAKSNIEFKKEVELEKRWDDTNWKELEMELLQTQKFLAKAKYVGDENLSRNLQRKIVRSKGAKMLAIRQVTNTNSEAGVDGVKWVSSFEKMQAALSLTSKGYLCQPYKNVLIHDGFSRKERYINIPTNYDKAMQILYSYALSPIAECTADRKSFAYRKGRSSFDVDNYVKIALNHVENAYVLKGDIKSYYDSISHEWLMKNLDMNKRVLKEFLQTGAILNGELFPIEQGISLGGSLSPLIGNIVLDGLQVFIYDKLYPDGIIQYEYGNMIRFADDFVVIVHDQEQGELVETIVKDFLFDRGLKLSEEKTKIVSSSEGFDFLGRNYIVKSGIVVVTPSAKSVLQFESKLEEKIKIHKGSIDNLIKTLNRMIQGYATYHKIEDAEFTFRNLDVVIQTLLIKKVKMLHPKRAWKDLQNMYWYRNHKNELVFTDPNEKNLQVIQLKDIQLINHFAVKTSFNYFLDSDYYAEIDRKRKIEKISGNKNKSIWNTQNGKCYFCGKQILPDHKIELIPISANEKQKAYIHKKCNLNYFEYKEIDNIEGVNTYSLLEKLKEDIIEESNKYQGLYEYFIKESRQVFTLTFGEIEIILGEELSDEAYVIEEYWFDHLQYLESKYLKFENKINYLSITDCWLDNGYIIQTLNMDQYKVIFRKDNHNLTQFELPKELIDKKIPKNAEYELATFCKYIIKKYGL